MDRELQESEESAQQDRERRDAYRAERAQEAADRRAANEAADAKARRAELERTLRDRFIAAGGSESEFLAAKESLIRDHLHHETLRANETAREAFGRTYQ